MVLFLIGGFLVMKCLMKYYVDIMINLDIKFWFIIELLLLSIILFLIRFWIGKVNDENFCLLI